MNIINKFNQQSKKIVNKIISYFLLLTILFLANCQQITSAPEEKGFNVEREEMINQAMVDYNDSFAYGQVKLDEGVKASFAIVESTAPNNEIAVDDNGVITVGTGLAAGTYAFAVKITKAGEDAGSEYMEEFTLTINPRTIVISDFSTSTSSVTKAFGYTNTSYGQVNLNGITSSLAIVDSSAPSGEISVDSSTGVITVAPGLAVNSYVFKVEVTGTGNYTGVLSTKGLSLTIGEASITASDFNVATIKTSESSGYPSSFNYGKINLNEGVTGSFAIVDSSAPSGEISVDSSTGVITVAPGLAVNSYTFKVEVSGTGNYQGSATADLSLIIGQADIKSSDFSVTETAVTKSFGYTDNSSYGQASLNVGVTGSFAIVESTAPNNEINVDANGNITVATGLSVGTYTFKVEVSGTGNYTGSQTTGDLTLVVNPKAITASDFSAPSAPNNTGVFGYGAFSYGAMTLNNGVTGSFAIVESTAPNNEISVDANGNITVATGLSAGTYTFKVEVSGTGNYTGSETTGDLTLVVNPRAITASDFSAPSAPNSSGVFGYGAFSYGTMTLNNGVTGSFAIVESTAPNNEISVDANGNIAVATGLSAGTYTFKVEVSGTGNYTGSKTTSDLTLAINPRAITASDFSAPSVPNNTGVFGYGAFSYGTMTLNNGVTGSFAIVESTAPNNEISVDANGNITVATGLSAGTYTFKVEVSGTGNYTGSETTGDLTLVVNPKAITASDISVTETSLIKSGPYADTSYGQVNLNPGITGSFAIVDSNLPANGVSVDASTGVITIGTGLTAGTYTFRVQVTGTGNYQRTALTGQLQLITQPEPALRLNNVFNYDGVAQNQPLNMPTGSMTAVVGGNPYLFTTGGNGLNVLRIENNGSLTFVDSIVDDGNTILTGARDLAITEINGTTFVYVSAKMENGVAVFSVADNGALTYIQGIADTAETALVGAWGIDIVRMGNNSYLYVSGADDNGVNAFRIGNDGRLTFISSLFDNDSRILQQPRGINIAQVGNNTYLFVAAHLDDGVSVFNIANNGDLTYVSDFTSTTAPNPPISRPSGVSVLKIDGDFYIFVSGINATTVFRVNENGTLTYRDDHIDDATTVLRGADNVDSLAVEGISLFLTAGFTDNGVTMFSYNDLRPAADRLRLITQVADTDNSAFELAGPWGLTSIELNGSIYLFFGGRNDAGISVFELVE